MAQEEEQLLCAYEGPLDSLGKVELFFLNLLAIPRLRVRLEALEFKLRFDEACCGVQTRLDAVAAACREINGSRGLVAVLELVLAMGNYMNAGAGAGDVTVGFDLGFLAKLGDTKSANEKTTFLHYLASVLERNGALATVVQELQSVEAAAQVSLDPTMAELAALSAGVALVRREAALLEDEQGGDDEFARSLNDFHAIAADVVQRCAVLGEAIRCVLFGGGPIDRALLTCSAALTVLVS